MVAIDSFWAERGFLGDRRMWAVDALIADSLTMDVDPRFTGNDLSDEVSHRGSILTK